MRLVAIDNVSSFDDFRNRLNADASYFEHFIDQITVSVTEMFRDPQFYQTLRDTILPELANLSSINIWHAGCSTGEEVYSMAILLEEAGLLHKTKLFATDINQAALEKAKEGWVSITQIKKSEEGYRATGGVYNFSAYYQIEGEVAKFNESLTRQIVFVQHNLVSDNVPEKFHLILCRNVMIYFDKDLQDRVLTLFDLSLETDGFLALGSKETLSFSRLSTVYRQLENREKIWRKVRRNVL